MKDRTALVTGASAGIGAVYADRLARRGHNLVLVARDRAKLEALAQRLQGETGVTAEVLAADLTNAADRSAVESRLKDDPRIGLLINNAGTSLPGGFVDADLDSLEKLIALNVTAVTRLAAAVAPRLAGEGSGAIVNIALGAGAGAGDLPRPLSRDQDVRADAVAVPAGRARSARRLCSGSAAGRHAHRHLGPVAAATSTASPA